MTEKQEKLLRQYCARVLLKYGFEFTTHDPIVPALYTIYSELRANKIGNEEVAKSIKSAMDNLNPTVYNFHERGEAWKFVLADSFRWFAIPLAFLGTIGIANMWWRQYNDVEKAREILSYSPRVERLLTMTKKDKHGVIYLEFTRAKSDSIRNFSEFFSVNQDMVKVPLGHQE